MLTQVWLTPKLQISVLGSVQAQDEFRLQRQVLEAGVVREDPETARRWRFLVRTFSKSIMSSIESALMIVFEPLH